MFSSGATPAGHTVPGGTRAGAIVLAACGATLVIAASRLVGAGTIAM